MQNVSPGVKTLIGLVLFIGIIVAAYALVIFISTYLLPSNTPQSVTGTLFAIFTFIGIVSFIGLANNLGLTSSSYIEPPFLRVVERFDLSVNMQKVSHEVKDLAEREMLDQLFGWRIQQRGAWRGKIGKQEIELFDRSIMAGKRPIQMTMIGMKSKTPSPPFILTTHPFDRFYMRRAYWRRAKPPLELNQTEFEVKSNNPDVVKGLIDKFDQARLGELVEMHAPFCLFKSEDQIMFCKSLNVNQKGEKTELNHKRDYETEIEEILMAGVQIMSLF